jgi:hypothetical protein
MLFRRFIIICLGSLVFGIALASIVQASRAGSVRPEGVFLPCSNQFHPACGRPYNQ